MILAGPDTNSGRVIVIPERVVAISDRVIVIPERVVVIPDRVVVTSGRVVVTSGRVVMAAERLPVFAERLLVVAERPLLLPRQANVSQRAAHVAPAQDRAIPHALDTAPFLVTANTASDVLTLRGWGHLLDCHVSPDAGRARPAVERALHAHLRLARLWLSLQACTPSRNQGPRCGRSDASDRRLAEGQSQPDLQAMVIPHPIRQWECSLTIEMPLRTAVAGPIPPRHAATLSAQVAAEVARAMDPEYDLPPGVFCLKFVDGVKGLFQRRYPRLGAKVSR